MWPNLLLVIAAAVFFRWSKLYRWIYIISKTYRRDFKAMIALVTLKLKLRYLQKRNATVATEFSSLAKKHPQKVAFYFEDDCWTFAQVENFANKVARYFKQQGLKKGDCIALLLENRPEYICIWMGLSKIGVVTALVNTNLVKDSLVHSIKIVNCTAVIFGSNLAEPIRDVLNKLESVKLYQIHEIVKQGTEILPGCVDLRHDLEGVSCDPIEKQDLSIYDPNFYFYTSGTTGLPKAAVCTHFRLFFAGCTICIATNIKEDDILYDPLPLYHGTGGGLGIGLTVLKGTTLVMRKKFSASNYWADCHKYKCTVALYIGEMCRYILAVPHKEPAKHSVRAIIGNGLRPQIWSQFVKKFNIKQVFEIYGASEAISGLINITNTVGSVGFIPRYLRPYHPLTLIKCNESTGEPIRGINGRCVECKINEAGLVVVKINQKVAILNFKGYSDQKETEKKILHDVFKVGDRYYNSGDILESDEFGNFYFKDRTGDTFRWKGENVSTSEVEAIISNLTQLNDAVVFGVEIPGTEGRAGMAAITDNSKMLDVDLLGQQLRENLPAYAVPIFIRVLDSAPITGTFKLKKVELKAEGYNVDKITDAMYFYNPNLKKYVVLTKDLHEQIINGAFRL